MAAGDRERPAPFEFLDRTGIYTIYLDDVRTVEEETMLMVRLLKEGLPENRVANKLPDFFRRAFRKPTEDEAEAGA